MLFPSKGLGCAEGGAAPWPPSTSSGEGSLLGWTWSCWSEKFSQHKQDQLLLRGVWSAAGQVPGEMGVGTVHTHMHTHKHAQTHRQAVQTHTHTHIYLYAPGILCWKGKMYSVSCSTGTQIPVLYKTWCWEATSISVLGPCLAAALPHCPSFFFSEKGYLGTENVKVIIASSTTIRLESLRVIIT